MHKKGSTPTYIGLFNDSFPPIIDGVTLTVENYAKWLTSHDIPTCVVTPWNPVSLRFPYDVVRFFSLPIHSRKPYRYGYPKMDPFIWHRLRNTPFSIVHSHCPFSSGRLAVYVKKKQGVPLVGTFHSKYESDLKHSFKLMPWCVPIIMKRIISFFNACDEVWIPQGYVEETVREYGYKGPLEVVANGIDYPSSDSSRPLADVKKEAREHLGIPSDCLSLLFVGQHIREKGILVIAEALGQLKGRVPFRMNYVGTGYAADELRRTVDRLGIADCVDIRGVETDREKLARYYAAADLFLFPSFYDNAPLVVREAAAMGTPSILLKGSTAAEVIRDTENGYLTERTPESYCKEIERLAADRAGIAKVGEEARRSLVKGWDEVMAEVTDRYRVLIKNHRK